MKGLPRSLRNNLSLQAVVKQVIKVNALAISVAGTSGVGWGTAVLGDLPAGNILLLGAASYLQFTSADADIQATYDGDYSVGTTATADATLSGTDVNVIPSTALGAATGGVSPVVRGASSGGAMGTILDNTDGSLELNLNLLIDDANVSGTADMTASGYVVIAYTVLGDD
jgi:hypothetical protein